MKKFFISIFSLGIAKVATTKKQSLQTQKNRAFLNDALKNCKTQQEIRIFQNLLFYYYEDFTAKQIIEFGEEILYKTKLLRFLENSTKNFYTPAEMYSILKNTTAYYQCDAIELHIKINLEQYKTHREDLSIYHRMIKKQKQFLLDQMEVNYESV